MIAGKEYGTGSSRDWAAKGPHLPALTSSSPRASNAFIALILSVWAYFLSSSKKAIHE